MPWIHGLKKNRRFNSTNITRPHFGKFDVAAWIIEFVEAIMEV